MSAVTKWPVDKKTGLKKSEIPTHVVQMMPAAPGMYAKVGGSTPGERTEYRLIVMWVLLDNGDATQDIIGLTANDIATGDIMHQGYEVYTTAVPKDGPNVTIMR